MSAGVLFLCFIFVNAWRHVVKTVRGVFGWFLGFFLLESASVLA